MLRRLTSPPFLPEMKATQAGRRRGTAKMLRWLSSFPGDTWQQRWEASQAEDHPGSSWVQLPLRWLQDNGLRASSDDNDLSSGLLMLICGDVIRPGLAWMLTRTHRYLALVMAETRDPAGFARLRELAEAGPASSLDDARYAATRVATLMACKGGLVSDITVGDCVELADTQRRVHARGGQRKVDFYLRLRALGIFPADAPATIRAFGHGPGTADRRGTRRPLPAAVQAGPRPARGLPEGTAARTGLRQPGLDLTRPWPACSGPGSRPCPRASPRCGCRRTSPAPGRKTCRRSSAASPAPTGSRPSSPGRGSTPRTS